MSISSLCRYPCHNTVSTKIHLKPLIYKISVCWPCSCFASTGLEVQPSLNRGMVLVIFGRGSDLSVSYLSVLHTHWCWTRFTQEKRNTGWARWSNQYSSSVSKTKLKNRVLLLSIWVTSINFDLTSLFKTSTISVLYQNHIFRMNLFRYKTVPLWN